jgi:hypothetical protein
MEEVMAEPIGPTPPLVGDDADELREQLKKGKPRDRSVKMTKMSWDNQPDPDDLNKALKPFGVYAQHADTGASWNTLVFSDRPLTADQVNDFEKEEEEEDD